MDRVNEFELKVIVIDRETNRSTYAARTKGMKRMWIIRVKVCNEVIPKIRFNLIYLTMLKDKLRSMKGMEFHKRLILLK